MTPGDFYEIVLTLAARHRASMTSGFRTWPHNLSLKGHVNSRHMLGYAIDLQLDPDSDWQALAEDARRFGLKATWEGDHLHVQTP